MVIEIRTNTLKPKKSSKAKSYEDALIKASSAKVEDLHVIANRTIQELGVRISEALEERYARLDEQSKKRLAYNAAYQRDLRTIKRLGLSVTVKQYRESLK